MGRVAALIVFPLLAWGCPGEEQPPPPTDRPRTIELRHKFHLGKAVTYKSKTVQRDKTQITVEMGYTWRALKIRPSGSAEVEMTIDRYSYSQYPGRELPSDAKALNESAKGARFLLLVPRDGQRVEQLALSGLPPISPASQEALRSTVSSQVLGLPLAPVRAGERWSRDRLARDAGPGAVSTSSRWRVLGIRRSNGRSLVELVCISTMRAVPSLVEGQLVRNRTEFHYSYLFDATTGLLEGMTSRGKTWVWSGPAQDPGDMSPVTTFEGSVVRISGPS